jgi:hypothetical protein
MTGARLLAKERIVELNIRGREMSQNQALTGAGEAILKSAQGKLSLTIYWLAYVIRDSRSLRQYLLHG